MGNSGRSAQDDDGQQVRVQMQVSELISPELYADLSATRVMARRYRLIHLATLGLLLERSMLQGGVGSVPALACATQSVSAVPERTPKKTSKKKGGAAKDVGNGVSLEVPSGFGDALVGELRI